MSTVPLPPWMRRIQQAWLYQNLAMPIGVGFFSSLILQGCLSDLFNIQFTCVHTAVNACASSLLTAWVKGHSVGSSDFRSDGNPIPAASKLKESADAAVALQQQASDTTSPVTQATATNAAKAVRATEATVIATADAVTQAAAQK